MKINRSLIGVLVVLSAIACTMFSCSGGGGDSSPTSALPACRTYTPFTTMPIAEGDFQYIAPLGALNPTGHTFPTNHIYLYPPTVEGVPVSVKVYSPGDVTVLQVNSTEHLSESPAYTDYTIYFSSCKEIWAYFGHVQSLSSGFSEKLGSMDVGSCSTYSTGGKSYKQCNKTTNFSVSAGEEIGTAGRAGQYALDFGMFDTRTGPLAYANPLRIEAGSGGFDDLCVVCPVDYFTEPAAGIMTAYFGSYEGWRTALPYCGEVMQDVVATAQGKWYNPASPDLPEDPHLALVHDNVDPTLAAFSVGTTLTGAADKLMTFTPLEGSRVNVDFQMVTADGNVYCYENLTNQIPNTIIVLQLTDDETLKIETLSASACGSGPWSFTSSAKTFKR